MTSVILINPWIYDFAAYDLWSKPLGLLYLASYLKKQKISTHVIDCMDPYDPEMSNRLSGNMPVRRKYGTGKYNRKEITKPDGLKGINRAYSRYGIDPDILKIHLKKIKNPSAILITSLMTYWYPGVIEAINIAKKIHPGVPVILGGIYARLCTDHALEYSGADIVADKVTLDNIKEFASILTGTGISYHDNVDINSLYPAFDTYCRTDYICLLTSTGCPFNCKYCASNFLYPSFSRRDPGDVVREIEYWNKRNHIIDFAFYDDALLVDSESHIIRILEKIRQKGLKVRFHTPNAIHVKEISYDIAALLFSSGFKTIRLGLETSDFNIHNRLDNKVSQGDFERAVKNLFNSGYGRKDIGAYILMGLPGQSVESVADTIKFADKSGAIPYLAEYSPLPGTPLWEEAVTSSDYDIKGDPIFHNNTILPCWDEEKRQKVTYLKSMIREIRHNNN
ncbi:B12-binding domain-containing radical SAM protein [Thermodesulfobacteriota bacterium]